jgi:signal peptidase II
MLETTLGSSALTEPASKPQKPKIYQDWLLIPVFAAVVIADQITKALIRANLHLHESVPDEGFFRLTYATNTGAVFGTFSDQTFIMTIASFVGVGILLYFYHAHSGSERLVRLSLGLLLGGAIGNLIDRIWLGKVTDFLDVGPWPIFNLADSAIVVGITVLVVMFLFERDNPVKAPLNNHVDPDGIVDEATPSIAAESAGNDD